LTGLVVLWATNLGRLLFIFWAGKQWGEHLALDILHPFVGLLIFNIGVVLMLLMLRLFGLHLGRGDHRAGRAPEAGSGGKPPTQPVFLATMMIAVIALVLSVNNTSLKSFNLVASASGAPKLSSFLVNPASPRGWTPVFTTEYTQNKSLFGGSSRWFRYTYFDRGGGDLSSTVPVVADVINAAGVSSFGAYGVEACYDFHGYSLRDIATVSLGDGISGQALSYGTKDNGDWSIVYWIWPVKTGTQTRYERIILYMLNTTEAQISLPSDVSGIHGLKRALSGDSALNNRLIVNRAFLVAFAREIITGQSRVVEDATGIGQVIPPGPQPLSNVALVVPRAASNHTHSGWLIRWRKLQAQYEARLKAGQIRPSSQTRASK
jgi:hypothetical protein